MIERKRLLRKLLPRRPKSVLYVDHVASGTDLFQVICDRDMEGVVAKRANAKYTPEATTWVKIKNQQYSHAAGRRDFFNRPRAAGRRQIVLQPGMLLPDRGSRNS